MSITDKLKSAATSNTKLKNVGAAAAQLSNKLSFTEKTQINAIKNVGGLTSTAGKLNSDVSAAISKLTNTQKAAMDLGSEMASKLESQGVFGKAAGKLIDNSLQNSVLNKTNLAKAVPKLPVDLSNWQNRLPGGKLGTKSAMNKMKKTKESLLGKLDLRYGGLTYPGDLVQEAAAYLKLQFFSYARPNAFEAGQVNDVEYVELPLPDNLSFAHGINYSPRDTGYLGDFMNSKAAGQIVADASAQKAYLDKLTSVTGNLGNTIVNADYMSAAGQGAMRAGYAGLESVDESLGGLAGQIIGAIPNPHPTVFFKGVELRQFQWTWKFVPRSPEEAETLQSCIKLMRGYILPSKDGNFLKYPHMVQPKIMGDNVDLYGSFKKCLVSSFSVNYTGEGTSAFYVDGSPVSIILAMNFQEVENFISDDV